MIRAVLLALVACLVTLSAATAQQRLVVSTLERKPFSFEANGTWAGFSIDLMEEIAARQGWELSYVEAEDFGDLLESVQNFRADIAAANISITSEREAFFDFSQPIFDSGLIVLAPVGGGASIFSVLFSRDLLLWVGGAILLLLGAGALIARIEAEPGRANAKDNDYDDGKIGGVGEGIWWAVNVVTQAGFEIPSPKTRSGRFLAFSLILTGLFAVSAFVAQITASLTVSELSTQLDGYNDLYGKRVGTTEGSTSARFLDSQRINYTGYGSLDEMFTALEGGELDAVVHDLPILAYYAANAGQGQYELVGRRFRSEKYGFAMVQGHWAKEELNRTLLQLTEDGTYDELKSKWFGFDF